MKLSEVAELDLFQVADGRVFRCTDNRYISSGNMVRCAQVLPRGQEGWRLYDGNEEVELIDLEQLLADRELMQAMARDGCESSVLYERGCGMVASRNDSAAGRRCWASSRRRQNT